MKETNKEVSRSHRLKNLWQRLGLKKPLGAFTDFNDDPELDFLWRRYITDETLYRSVFRSMDRVKLTIWLVGRVVMVQALMRCGVVKMVAPFHNYFTLHGTKRFEHEDSDTEELGLEDEEEMKD